MNTQEYIASGILEMYVMGVTSAEETREVENFARKYPEIKAEIEAIRNAVENYALSAEKNPPADLKEKIFSAIKNETHFVENNGAKIIPLNAQKNNFPEKKSNTFTKYLAAASIVLLITSVFLNYVFYKNWKNTETNLATTNTAKDGYANQMQIENTNYQTNLKALTDTANKIIKMKGLAISPQAMATVYWNPSSKTVCIHVNNLPAPPANKQYQLWAIVNGKPVSEGVFDTDKDLQFMQPVAGAQAFAVTLEQKGGSPTPTMTAMYVLGNV